MLPTQQNKSLLHNIATTIPPAETEVCRTLENTTCSDQVLPISILLLNFVKRWAIRLSIDKYLKHPFDQTNTPNTIHSAFDMIFLFEIY
jgi:hypothetical protein